MIYKLLTLSRPLKRVISIFADSLFIFTAYWGAFYTRLGESANFIPSTQHWYVLVCLVIFTVLIYIKSGLYRAILRYMNTNAVLVVGVAALISSLSLVSFSYYFKAFLPRSVPIIYFTYVIALSGGARMMMRAYVNRLNMSNKEAVIIYGAGAAGRQLTNLVRQSEEYKVAAFIDDKRNLQGSIIQGVAVFGRSAIEKLQEKYGVNKVLLAIPSASRTQRRDIFEYLSERQFEVLTVPNFDSLISGTLSLDQLKEVSIDDLLGRPQVEPIQSLLQANIFEQNVMVTGAGGSIGSELCRQILKQKPTRLVLFERSEFALYSIERELRPLANALNIELLPILGNVQNYQRLCDVMRSFDVDTVYHAAAYKHVPLVEFNVVEGVANNVEGTYQTALAAIECDVQSFVLISTDKAVRPTNVMGTTKRLAELGLQALAEQEASKKNGTRFCMVRFGNVLGSSGSVIPLFKKQIESGGPITVTHPEITRYFMTIPEAAQLVIQAGAMGKGGDVFVLDMGQPVKISQLAESLIHLSGREIRSASNPDGDIEIHYTGLRPGEKLYEELLIGDNVLETAHSRIMSANESFLSLKDYDNLRDRLNQYCLSNDLVNLRQLLIDAPTGFNPTGGISDLTWGYQTEGDDHSPELLKQNCG